MKTLFTIILSLFTYISMSVSSGIDIKEIDFDDEPDLTKLYQTMWLECRGENIAGQRKVISVIKNRIAHKHFPSTLDSVLNQPYQFVTLNVYVPDHFTAHIDSLWHKPSICSYLYFIHPLKAKKASWMRRKVWVKHGRHSFAL